MQCGYDQDFPKWIPRSPSSSELAWYNYKRAIDFDLRVIECQVDNYPEVPPSFSLRWKKKHITEEIVHASINYVRDRNGSSSVVSHKCNM
ncbi:hypothetical protein KY284_035904 [Solanum tuberosum]|nr:hypothetical protein KY284_035904 [Solanum tuberosum]